MDRAAWHSRVHERHRQLAWWVRHPPASWPHLPGHGTPARLLASASLPWRSSGPGGIPLRAWRAQAGPRMRSVYSFPGSGISVRHRALTAFPHNKRAHARQMPAKLKFRVVHASSEDPEFPSTELNAHSPHTVPSLLPPADRECARVGARFRCEENPAGHGARCVAYWWRAACFPGAGGMAERAILRIPTGARLPVCRARSPHAASGARARASGVCRYAPGEACRLSRSRM